MRRPIYLDHNATTPMAGHVCEAIADGMALIGNPSSAHQLGRKSRETLEKTRINVASAAGSKSSEIVFTSGGSEANGLALMGSYFSTGDRFRLLTSTVEHSSIRDLAKWLESKKVEVRTVRVGSDGNLDLMELKEQLGSFRPHLTSLMSANNETGVVFPIPEIADLCHEAGGLFHTDAVQGLGKLTPSHWAKADFVSLSGHKIYGPKGIGALIVREGRTLSTTHFGGAQETKRRGGTENLLGIIGFGAATGTKFNTQEDWDRMETLRDRLERKLEEADLGLEIQSKRARRLGNTSCVRVPGVTSEILLSVLDMEGIYISAGSACSSGSIAPSHVLLAMGHSRESARECVRISLGRETTSEEVDTLVEAMVGHITRIRSRKKT